MLHSGGSLPAAFCSGFKLLPSWQENPFKLFTSGTKHAEQRFQCFENLAEVPAEEAAASQWPMHHFTGMWNNRESLKMHQKHFEILETPKFTFTCLVCRNTWWSWSRACAKDAPACLNLMLWPSRLSWNLPKCHLQWTRSSQVFSIEQSKQKSKGMGGGQFFEPCP